MPRRVATREEAIRNLVDSFRALGFEGASLSRLTEATGLKSSSLYNYFPGGKEEMAAAALAHLGARLTGEILPLLEGPEPPALRAERFAEALGAFYEGGRASCLIEVFSLGAARAAMGSAVREAVRLLIGRLAGLAEAAGAGPAEAARRAEDALIAIEGALVVGRALDSTDPLRRVLAELPERLTCAPAWPGARSRAAAVGVEG